MKSSDKCVINRKQWSLGGKMLTHISKQNSEWKGKLREHEMQCSREKLRLEERLENTQQKLLALKLQEQTIRKERRVLQQLISRKTGGTQRDVLLDNKQPKVGQVENSSCSPQLRNSTCDSNGLYVIKDFDVSSQDEVVIEPLVQPRQRRTGVKVFVTSKEWRCKPADRQIQKDVQSSTEASQSKLDQREVSWASKKEFLSNFLRSQTGSREVSVSPTPRLTLTDSQFHRVSKPQEDFANYLAKKTFEYYREKRCPDRPLQRDAMLSPTPLLDSTNHPLSGHKDACNRARQSRNLKPGVSVHESNPRLTLKSRNPKPQVLVVQPLTAITFVILSAKSVVPNPDTRSVQSNNKQSIYKALLKQHNSRFELNHQIEYAAVPQARLLTQKPGPSGTRKPDRLGLNRGLN